ncbi:MAG: hemerythrin domain-containing protein [Woeseiaceae bacterium]
MAAPAVKLPGAIVTLQDEHRYMNLLLETLEEHLQASDLSAPEEHFLMQDIMRYLHEYPDAVHHPTEDLLFDKLVRRKPDTEKDIARLRRDHKKLGANTADILRLLDDAAELHTPASAEAVRVELGKYIGRLRRHMSFEEAELFPVAVQCLANRDWQAIESRLNAVQDPLFGSTVARDYRVLYEYFANRANRLSRGATRFGFLQLDSMIVSADAIETGISEMIEMLQRHTESLVQESRDTVHDTFKGGSIGNALTAQARFMGFVGKKGVNVAWDAAGIYIKTIRNAAQPLWNIKP